MLNGTHGFLNLDMNLMELGVISKLSTQKTKPSLTYTAAAENCCQQHIEHPRRRAFGNLEGNQNDFYCALLCMKII